MVILEGFLELGAGDHVVIALAPGRAIVGVVDGHSLQFGVVMAEMDDEFRHSGLQVLDRVQVETLPVGRFYVGTCHH